MPRASVSEVGVRVMLLSRAALVASYRPKVDALARRPDVELTVVVPPRWKEPDRVQELEPGPTPGYDLVVERLAVNGSFHLHWYPRLGRRLRTVRPDVLYVEEEPYNVATWHATRLASRLGIRTVCFTWQNIAPRYPPPFTALERATLRRVDHLACGSAESVAVWRAKGFTGSTSVVQSGVDLDTWAPPATQRPPRPFTVGYVGRLVEAKGVDGLVRAFAAAALPADARLLLAGDGAARDTLEAEARELGVAGRTEFRAWTPSAAMPALMHELDVLVLPSRTRPEWKEQFGRVLVEAMASGVVVVGSDSGAIPDVIGDAGLVVPEGDDRALADTLEELASDEALRRDLARRGRARAVARFSHERIAAQTLDACRAATRRRPRVTVVAHEVHDDGGMEAAMAQLVRRATCDYDVTVVTSRLAPDLRARVRWRRVRIPPAPVVLRILAFALQAAPVVDREPADVVHTLGALVPNRADLATVAYCHAGVPADVRTTDAGDTTARRVNARLAHRVSVAAERWCYRPARLRRAAAVSRGVAGEFAAAYPGIPVSITPNGVDLVRFAPDPAVRHEVRRDAGVATDDVVVLFVGGDWVRKGLAVAIGAVGRLARTGAPVRLWVVGRGDEDRYRALAAEEGVADRVTFFGFRPDRERFFRGADVFTLPSAYETFCIAAFEAAAAELPIVMTPVNDVGALVRDGTGGALVERNPDVLAAALAPFVSDPVFRNADGRAARARVQRYTWDASTASVLDLYRELLEVREP
jgi:glycosyltransferase involved in cell wall biosynthesis